MAIIGIDFDGTCVTHEYPEIGKDVGAVPVLKELVEAGHQLILWTMRSKETLEDAAAWFSSNGIALYGVNNNPTQETWTSSRKVYCHLYIDDAALGIPLLQNPANPDSRPFVDWGAVRKFLTMHGYLHHAN